MTILIPDEVSAIWPKTWDLEGYGIVHVVQPGQLYAKGTTVAVGWASGGPGLQVLRPRAEKLGTAWYVDGWPGIGVQISSDCTGAKIINTLTENQWKGMLPILVPDNLVQAGLLLEGAHGAIDDAAAAAKKVIDAAGDAAALTSAFVAAVPWIIGSVIAVAIVGVVGIVVYKVTRKR